MVPAVCLAAGRREQSRGRLAAARAPGRARGREGAAGGRQGGGSSRRRWVSRAGARPARVDHGVRGWPKRLAGVLGHGVVLSGLGDASAAGEVGGHGGRARRRCGPWPGRGSPGGRGVGRHPLPRAAVTASARQCRRVVVPVVPSGRWPGERQGHQLGHRRVRVGHQRRRTGAAPGVPRQAGGLSGC